MKDIYKYCFLLILSTSLSVEVFSATLESRKVENEIIKQNLVMLFTDITFSGCLGDDCYRIDIYFNSAQRKDSTVYQLSGKSRFKNNIYLFQGNLMIDNIELLSSPIKNEVEDIDGYITGKYLLDELGNKTYCGCFSGNFKVAFRFNSGVVEQAIMLVPETKINIYSFSGKWTSYTTQRSKPCCWGDNLIPCAPDDFYEFNDAGEGIVTPKYRKYGWNNLYNAYYNCELSPSMIEKAQKVEEKKWWLNNKK